MKRAGRVSFLMLVGIVAVVGVIVLLFFGRANPTAAASQFMEALAKGDVPTLTRLSHMEGRTPEQVREAWEFTTSVPGKHYRFVWNFTGQFQPNDTTATVSMRVWRNFGPAAFDEKFELPLVKKDGQWKVDVREINREMYPGLPR